MSGSASSSGALTDYEKIRNRIEELKKKVTDFRATTEFKVTNLTDLIKVLEAYKGNYQIYNQHFPADIVAIEAKLQFLRAVDENKASLTDVHNRINAKIQEQHDKPFDESVYLFGIDSIDYRRAMIEELNRGTEQEAKKEVSDLMTLAKNTFSESFQYAAEISEKMRETALANEKLKAENLMLKRQIEENEMKFYGLGVGSKEYVHLRKVVDAELEKIKNDKKEKERLEAIEAKEKAVKKKEEDLKIKEAAMSQAASSTVSNTPKKGEEGEEDAEERETKKSTETEDVENKLSEFDILFGEVEGLT